MEFTEDMQFWIEDGNPVGREGSFHMCSKQGRFWDAVYKVDGMYQDILSNGVKGKKILWVKKGSNYEIEKVMYGDEKEI